MSQNEEQHEVRRRPRILVAGRRSEDHALLVTALRDEGYDVVEIRDGMQMLSRLRAWADELTSRPPFDLVITDARLSGGFAYGVVDGPVNSIPDGATALLRPLRDSTSRVRRFRISAVLEAPYDLGELMSAVRTRVE